MISNIWLDFRQLKPSFQAEAGGARWGRRGWKVCPLNLIADYCVKYFANSSQLCYLFEIVLGGGGGGGVANSLVSTAIVLVSFTLLLGQPLVLYNVLI